ncbi:MAG: hypothetical protein FWC38_03895 [Proteobacteria bacterium]|nr:hypothetical protein [Pseudomonadota bacterium]MCL2307367.1 hypothetical protein [Pseudomonadota bacterium]
MTYVWLPESQDTAARNITTIIYALYALAPLIPLTVIVAIVMNYVKKDDMKGTLYESHFRWQINTFWFALLWSLLSILLALPLIVLFLLGMVFLYWPAFFFLIVVFIWYVYRIVKGWLRLTEKKAMYE